MALAQLQAQLTQLAITTPLDLRARQQTLAACCRLLLTLTNPHNSRLLLAALLQSDALWDGDRQSDKVAYDVCAAVETLLLPAQAGALSQAVCQVCANLDDQIPAWRRAVLLAAFLAAEQKEAEGPPAAYAFWTGKCAAPCVQALNAASLQEADNKLSRDAACLVAYSYIAEYLTGHQAARLTSELKRCWMVSLMESDLVWHDAASRGRSDLGLLTRLLSSLIVQDPFNHHEEASTCLLRFAESIRTMPPQTQRQAFLCVLLLQQAILRSFLLQPPPLQPDVKVAIDTRYAELSLQVLQHLQGVHPDNTAFEPWRFVFGGSLDLLSQAPSSLETFSARAATSADETWRLLVLESAAPDLSASSTTVQPAFLSALEALSLPTPGKQDKALLELRHSVCLALLLAHPKQLQAHVRPYLEQVFADWEIMTERQVRLVFLSLYQLSLKLQQQQQQPDESVEEDTFGILQFIQQHRETASAAASKTLLLAHIDLLPFLPPTNLADHCSRVSALVTQSGDQACAQRFEEVCTSEMDGERAMVVVRWRLGPSTRAYL